MDFKYDPKTGQTDLTRPSGGFYSLDELKGSTPGEPLVPYANPPQPTHQFDWQQYQDKGSYSGTYTDTQTGGAIRSALKAGVYG